MTLSYELAKQLKDAGFPHQCIEYSCGKDDYCHHEECLDGHHICVPPLLELIEACGKTTIKLWINGDQGKSGVQLPLESLDDVVWYDSPEEAMAHCWLSLNKK